MNRRDLLAPVVSALLLALPARAQNRSYAVRAVQRNQAPVRINFNSSPVQSPSRNNSVSVSAPTPRASVAHYPAPSRRFSATSAFSGHTRLGFRRAAEPSAVPTPLEPEAPAPQFGALVRTAGLATRYGPEPTSSRLHEVDSGGGFIQMDQTRSLHLSGIGVHPGRPDRSSGSAGTASGRTAITTREP